MYMKKLKICLISKYPPHKGGTANGNYWYARSLSELGHEVHVVTRYLKDEDNYFKNLGKEDLKEYGLKNVKIYTLDRELPVEQEILALTNLAVEVIRKNNINVIEAKYILPYGMVGFLSKTLTKKPLVIKHVGNDMYLSSRPEFKTIITEVLKNSDIISIEPSIKEEMIKMGIKEEKLTSQGGANYSFFNPDVKPYDFSKKLGKKIDAPLIGCMGKVMKHKGGYEFLRAVSKINEDFYIVLNEEMGMEYIKKYVNKFGLEKRAIFLDYQPPWKMPSIYNSLTALVSTEVDFPSKIHTPLMAIEALRAGVCTIISHESHEKMEFRNLKNRENVIVVDPKNTEEYSKTLKWVIKNPSKTKEISMNARNFYSGVDYKENIKRMIKIYGKMGYS